MEWKERIRRWRGTLRDDRRRRSLVWLAVLAGLFLLLLPRGEKAAEPPAQDTVSAFDLAETESRLAETLSRIDGAGEVTVMLAVRDGPRQLLAQDLQRGDQEERAQTVVLSAGSGVQETVTVQEVSPAYQGALLVCPGGDDPRVRLQLTQAVSALTGLGADKISISKGK